MKVLKFLVAGLLTALLDNGIFFIVHRATGFVFLSLAASTTVSVIFNYLVVRKFIFEAQVGHAGALPKYLSVHFTGMLIRYGIIRAILWKFHIRVEIAKLVADGIVYSLKYVIQRDFVFRERTTHTVAPGSDQSGLPASPVSTPPVTQPQSESLL